MYPFRVFLSHSHEDMAIVEAADKSLRQAGLVPVWDRNIRAGMPLTATVREFIDHVHLFIPLITKTSRHSAWVHEEIGYAVAREIPVLPVCSGVKPSQMISEVLPLKVKQADFSDLGSQLDEDQIASLMLRASSRSRDLIEIAHWHEERTERLAR